MSYSDAFDQRCGVGILRLQEGFDCSVPKLNAVGGTHIASSVIMMPMYVTSMQCRNMSKGWTVEAEVIRETVTEF